MLRGFLNNASLFNLPILATFIFVAMFATVLVRVCQRSRRPQYDRMASLPLAEDAEEVR